MPALESSRGPGGQALGRPGKTSGDLPTWGAKEASGGGKPLAESWRNEPGTGRYGRRAFLREQSPMAQTHPSTEPGLGPDGGGSVRASDWNEASRPALHVGQAHLVAA